MDIAELDARFEVRHPEAFAFAKGLNFSPRNRQSRRACSPIYLTGDSTRGGVDGPVCRLPSVVEHDF